MKYIHVLSATSELQPVSQWNLGKKEEFEERRNISLVKIREELDIKKEGFK